MTKGIKYYFGIKFAAFNNHINPWHTYNESNNQNQFFSEYQRKI